MSNPKIIAVDFDGCLATNNFPDIGEPILETIDVLILKMTLRCSMTWHVRKYSVFVTIGISVINLSILRKILG